MRCRELLRSSRWLRGTTPAACGSPERHLPPLVPYAASARPESDAEIVLQRAREAHFEAKPHVISDRGFPIYKTTRLHSALGYVALADRLAGRHTAIFQTRDQKLETARETRKFKRQRTTALAA